MQFTRSIAFVPLLFIASVFPSLSSPHAHASTAKTGSENGDGVTSAGGSVSGDSIQAEVQFNAPARNSKIDCSWRPVLVMTQGARSSTNAVRVVGADGVSRSLFWKTCDDNSDGYFWIRDDVPPRAEVAARDKVSKLLNMLVTKSAPPLEKQVVNVGTWFWVPRAGWKPKSVTAYIELPIGVITVTTTATPTTLTYSPGDGHQPVSCEGPGRAWGTSLGDNANTNCMYTYRSASHTMQSHTYRSRMAVTWKITWRSNLGIGGTVGHHTIGVPMKSRVFEMQALAR